MNPGSSRDLPSSVRRGPDSERIRASFISNVNRLVLRRRPAIEGSHHRSRWTLFNKLPQGGPGTGRWPALQVWRRVRTSRRVVRSTSGVSMHSETMSQGVGGPGCARSWPDLVQRNTTSDGTFAFGHSRSGPLTSKLGRPPCRQGHPIHNPEEDGHEALQRHRRVLSRP